MTTGNVRRVGGRVTIHRAIDILLIEIICKIDIGSFLIEVGMYEMILIF